MLIGCGNARSAPATLFDDLSTLVESLHAPNVVHSPHLYFGSVVQLPFISASRRLELHRA